MDRLDRIIEDSLKVPKYTKVFQKMYKLYPDGIAGSKTMGKLHILTTRQKLKYLNKQLYKATNRIDPYTSTDETKNRIMRYLGKTEGEYLHKNKSESTVTSPYGIYRKTNPNAEVFKYLQSLIMNYPLKRYTLITNKNLINNLIEHNIDIRRKVIDLVYEYYQENYMEKRVIPYLSASENLALLSMSILTGRRRANKFLQQALGITADGVVGGGTIGAVKNKGGDITNRILDKAQAYLTSLNNKRYIKGWTNRVNVLRV